MLPRRLEIPPSSQNLEQAAPAARPERCLGRQARTDTA